ncbi:DUF2264 domain-containing protein [Microbacterium sp. XT11]|uniref:DUF2264 domain-containing protein n=1 Tax=Microbacterium sp. XT11 TaxID=367477 RepID=UPI0009FA894D|nr:DUF2264 domain-containing protein [Microbacterium sp. XT11]
MSSRIRLPEDDRALSPYTGWTRTHWLTVADTVLEGARRHASPSGALVRYPGAPGGFGSHVDGLEGFTRTFMLAAFRIAGDPDGTQALAERCARAIAAGVDRAHPERWPRPDEVDQAKVEAAALAVGLHLVRDAVWARLDETAQAQTIDYLASFIGGSRPPNNWAWFRLIVEQFLENVGGPFSDRDREEDFALLDSFDRDGGWIADGAGRSFDHYSGWALPFYPVIWADMVAGDPRHAARIARYRARLDDYLDDALHLIGADGAPLIQGRSLTYRFATAGPAWAAAFTGGTRHDLGMLRRAASGQARHFVERGAPDAGGVLPLGWHRPWRAIAQDYSGPGSPYWAAKGMLGIALPADHPVWTATEAPLPIDRGDVARVLTVPGWLVSGTASDGIVRVVNHGTDHRIEGDLQPDAPLYAKLGYSTATAPVLAGDGVAHPVDGTVAILRDGRPSHRSGFAVGELRDDRGTLLGASAAPAHWPLELVDAPDTGVGAMAARTELGPLVEIASAVRSAWEVRFVRVAGAGLRDGDLLRIGGWALSSDTLAVSGGAGVTDGERSSRLIALHGLSAASGCVDLLDDVTPLAPRTAVPRITAPVPADRWAVVAVLLGAASDPPAVRAETTDSWRIDWPDGAVTIVEPGALVPRAAAGRTESAARE